MRGVMDMARNLHPSVPPGPIFRRQSVAHSGLSMPHRTTFVNIGIKLERTL